MKKLVLIFCFNLLVSVCMSQQYDIGIHAGLFSATGIGIYNMDISVRPCQRFRSNGATLKDATK